MLPENSIEQIQRKIIHVDMDAFYAAIEQRDNPELLGKPVVVGGSPRGRGVVATASYEARKFGIKSAIPTAKAYRLCPHAIFVKPRFEAYKKASSIIREIFFEYTDLVEPLSLDEAYLDVTENKVGLTSAIAIAREIRKRIFEETQLTASAGVAPNKFLAKVASDIRKPNGLTVILPHQAEEFIEKLPIGKFHGVGKATEEKMNRFGIFTGADLKKFSEIELSIMFGKSGSYYFRIARAIDNRPVRPFRLRKSLGAERTFSDDLDDMNLIKEKLIEIADEVERRLQKSEIAGKTVTLKVRYNNFERITRSFTTDHWVDTKQEMLHICETLIQQTEIPNRKIRLLGITLSHLNNEPDEDGLGKQLELNLSRTR